MLQCLRQNLFRNRTLNGFLALSAGFFLLYALTAQRGLGWGDSGEFQYRILEVPLSAGLSSGCDSFATAHPLYVLFGKLVAHTPFEVTLLSSFFGALAVGGLFLCTRKVHLAILFGLSHAFWWLSCVAEVYTMMTAFIAFETFFLLRFLKRGSRSDLAVMMFLNGLDLCVHNVAMFSLPAYGIMLLLRGRRCWVEIPVAAVSWAVGASLWIYGLFSRGVTDVLFGGYGGAALGFWPENWTIAGFNYALTLLSVAVPAMMFVRCRRMGGRPLSGMPWEIVALALVHAFFWARYFNVSQFTFFLPTLFFLYMLLSHTEMRVAGLMVQGGIQLLLPIAACILLSGLTVPEWYSYHAYRNEASYFALPWKFHDDSADRCAMSLGGVWNGYPNCQRGEGL